MFSLLRFHWLRKSSQLTPHMMYVLAAGMSVCGVGKDACLSKNPVQCLEFVWAFPPFLFYVRPGWKGGLAEKGRRMRFWGDECNPSCVGMGSLRGDGDHAPPCAVKKGNRSSVRVITWVNLMWQSKGKLSWWLQGQPGLQMETHPNRANTTTMRKCKLGSKHGPFGILK